MSVHRLKRGDRAFSLNLRRIVRIVRVLEKHCRYEVEALGNHMNSEEECYGLLELDARSQKKIDELERVMKDLEGLR